MKPTLLIVGLGNPGKEYEETRHNIGFRVLEKLREEFGEGEWQVKQKLLGDTLEARIVAAPLLLLKPTTYMNRSGEAVQKALKFFKLVPSQLLVLCDDIDLAPGTVRLRLSGGPGTHNGLRSIVEHIGEGFPRIRIGVGVQKSGEDLSAYVLSRPTAEERKKIAAAIEEIPDLVREFVMGDTKE